MTKTVPIIFASIFYIKLIYIIHINWEIITNEPNTAHNYSQVVFLSYILHSLSLILLYLSKTGVTLTKTVSILFTSIFVYIFILRNYN